MRPVALAPAGPPPAAPADRGRPAPPASGSGARDRARVGEVAEQFEAIFLRQIVRELRKTVSFGEEKFMFTEAYSDIADEQLAEHLARSGGLGLAGVIRAYLEGSRR